MHRLFKNATVKVEKLQAKLDSKNVDEDKALDLIDLFNDVRNKAHADNCTDVEMEGIASAHLGHIYYLGLKNSKKAKTYYLDSKRLVDTLPKSYTHEKWHQNMMNYMLAINQE